MNPKRLALPSNWQVTRVDRVARVSARIGWKALTAAEYQPDGYAFLATPNIKGRDIDFENVNYISEFRYNESPELKLTVGDVLLAKDGNTLGITNIVRTLPRPATVNGSIAVLRPSGIHGPYLMYALASTSTQQAIQAIKGGMGVPHLFQWDINRLPVPLPPMDEQQRIANFLDSETARLDRAIEARNREVALLSERRLAAFEACVTCNNTDSVIHPLLGSIHQSWAIAQLRRFSSINVGVVINPSSYFTDEGVPFIHGFNVQRGFIEATGMKFLSRISNDKLKRSQLRLGDVLVVRAGTPGRAAAVTEEYVDANCASVLIVRRSSRILPEFMTAFFNSGQGRGQVKFSQYGAAQEVISAGQVAAFLIAVPPIDEQRMRVRRLTAECAALDAANSLLHRHIETMRERKQALITAAVTGQFDVTTGRGADLS